MAISQGITLITSKSRPRYATDALNVLALPSGMKYHFRYDRKYLNDDLINQFENQDPKGTKVLIVFCDEFNTSDPFMVPIRWAIIEEVRQISDFYVIWFRLNSYPVFSRSFSGQHQAMSDACKQYLGKFPGDERSLPIHLGLTPFVEMKGGNDDMAWMEIARRLSLHSYFKNTFFIRISAKKTELRPFEKFGNEGYLLSESRYACIQLDFFAAHYGADENKVYIRSDNTVLRVASSSVVHLDSRYDSRDVLIQAGAVSGTTFSLLEIETSCDNKLEPQTKLNMPFVVTRNMRVTIIRMILGGIGGALVSLPGVLGMNSPLELRVAVAFVGAIALAATAALFSKS
jgi:hypothetical protein